MTAETTAVIKAAVWAARKAKNSKTFRYVLLVSFLLPFLPLFFIFSFGISFAAANTDGASKYSSMVESYRPQVMQSAPQYDMSDYVDLVLAVMQQESGGYGDDPMQASECGYNKKYPQKKNGITDPAYSLECGIQELHNCLLLAGVKNPGDMGNISLALQGYNFGCGFIAWAYAHGGYSLANAEAFSAMEARQLGYDSYGDPNYVDHVLRYYNTAGDDTESMSYFNDVKKAGESLLNTPYVLGADNPGVAMDCSSFVCYVYSKAGKNMPRVTAQGIYDLYCSPVSADKVEAGDLIFFTKTYNCKSVISHVGIYCGNGVMLEEGGKCVHYESCDNSYWKKHFYAYGRVK